MQKRDVSTNQESGEFHTKMISQTTVPY